MNTVTTETGDTLPTATSTDSHNHIIEKNHYISASNIDSTQITREQRQMQALERRAAAARHALVNMRTGEEG